MNTITLVGIAAMLAMLVSCATGTHVPVVNGTCVDYYATVGSTGICAQSAYDAPGIFVFVANYTTLLAIEASLTSQLSLAIEYSGAFPGCLAPFLASQCAAALPLCSDQTSFNNTNTTASSNNSTATTTTLEWGGSVALPLPPCQSICLQLDMYCKSFYQAGGVPLPDCGPVLPPGDNITTEYYSANDFAYHIVTGCNSMNLSASPASGNFTCPLPLISNPALGVGLESCTLPCSLSIFTASQNDIVRQTILVSSWLSLFPTIYVLVPFFVLKSKQVFPSNLMGLLLFCLVINIVNQLIALYNQDKIECKNLYEPATPADHPLCGFNFFFAFVTSHISNFSWCFIALFMFTTICLGYSPSQLSHFEKAAWSFCIIFPLLLTIIAFSINEVAYNNAVYGCWLNISDWNINDELFWAWSTTCVLIGNISIVGVMFSFWKVGRVLGRPLPTAAANTKTSAMQQQHRHSTATAVDADAESSALQSAQDRRRRAQWKTLYFVLLKDISAMASMCYYYYARAQNEKVTNSFETYILCQISNQPNCVYESGVSFPFGFMSIFCSATLGLQMACLFGLFHRKTLTVWMWLLGVEGVSLPRSEITSAAAAIDRRMSNLTRKASHGLKRGDNDDLQWSRQESPNTNIPYASNAQSNNLSGMSRSISSSVMNSENPTEDTDPTPQAAANIIHHQDE